ncbi:MAG TPA: hypothetical protein VK968_07245, partial [Roseimicrobium sp.]|nr:hypothetical protein [Roseimicrobium sp.]
GQEFQANSFTTSDQANAAVAMDLAGNFVVTWESTNQDGNGYGIYAQRYTADGEALGSEFQVNTYTSNNQFGADVAMDGDGDFVITWQSSGQDGSSYGVYARHYGSDGQALDSEFRVNTSTSSFQRFPAVAMDGDGDFVITWESYHEGTGLGVYAQRFASDGQAQGSELHVNTTLTGQQSYPDVAIDGDGDFVITWQSESQDGSQYNIFAQRYTSAGLAQGSEFRVNSYTTEHQSSPEVALDGDGDFVIVWTSNNQDSDSPDIFAQRFASTGGFLGSEFRVNSYTTQQQFNPAVAMDSSGDFVVSWQSYDQDGPYDNGIYAQRFTATGQAEGSEFQVNTYTSNGQSVPALAVDSQGGFAVFWHSAQDGAGNGIFGRRFQLTD